MAYDSKEWKWENPDGSYTVRTCAWSPPGEHPVGWGVELTVKDGKLIGVEGDDHHPITHGRLGAKQLDLIEYTYHPDRIIYPMKRDPKDRGKDKWERITWDEAYDLIESEVRRIKREWGAESILVFGGTGREACLYYYPLAFATLQTPNVCYAQSGWSCYCPRCAVSNFILGAGYPEVDYAGYYVDRFDNPSFELPKLIVNWGKAPLESNGDGFYGHSEIDMMKLGTKIINVDPRKTWLGTREGNMTLQLKPGSDAALALGILNVIINEDLYDHDFVENWTFGFEELSERVQQYSPEKVEELTWVPKEQIIEAARMIATERPSSFAWGLAVDQNPNGNQIGQSIIAIWAITGNLDVPGGVTLGPPESLLGVFGAADNVADIWDKRIAHIGGEAFNTVLATTHPDETLDVLESGLDYFGNPYPLKMAWYNSSNLLTPTCSAQPKRWHDALQKMEFGVVQDLYMTPTAMALADVFLPLPTFAEHNGIVLPHYGRNTVFIGATNEALRVGETRSDIEVCLELGKRLNPAAWPWATPEEFFSVELGPIGFNFEELQEMSLFQPGYEYRKFETGGLRPDGEPGFNTVTGKVELMSALFEGWDEDPLPYYERPRFDPEDRQWSDQYPFVLTTGARTFLSFHSEQRQTGTALREIYPWPEVELHPEAAASLGLTDGDWVAIETPFGTCNEKVRVTPTIDPRVVHARHGWWYPEQDGEEPNLFGVWKSNANSLIPHKCIGKLGMGAPYKSLICKITKIDGLNA